MAGFGSAVNAANAAAALPTAGVFAAAEDEGRGAPPPGRYNDPVGYGLPATWMPPNSVVAYPVVWNPQASAWGVFVPGGTFVPYAT